MRSEYLMGMPAEDIDRYAARIGIDVAGERDKAAKVRAIQERRGRVATVQVLGTSVDVPVKRLHDKRVTDAFAAATDDDGLAKAVGLLLGADQWDAIVERCTEEDGTVDNDALGLAVASILQDDELKNF